MHKRLQEILRNDWQLRTLWGDCNKFVFKCWKMSRLKVYFGHSIIFLPHCYQCISYNGLGLTRLNAKLNANYMLQTANVSNQTWHGRSVAVFGCQMFKKWPLKVYFLWEVICKNLYYYIGNDCRELLSFKNRIGCQFEVILRWGTTDSRSTLLGFWKGLDRYLNNPHRTRKASTLPPTQRSSSPTKC